MALHTVDFRVKGKVQRVYFREFTKDLAQRHSIVGWVKNESVSTLALRIDHPNVICAHSCASRHCIQSGDVIGTAQGSPEALEKLYVILIIKAPSPPADLSLQQGGTTSGPSTGQRHWR